jgi:methyl-accepting chemotaxis protein
MKLMYQLLAGFLIVSVIICVIGIVAYENTRTLTEDLHMAGDRIVIADHTARLEESMYIMQLYSMELASSASKQEMESIVKKLHAEIKHYDDLSEELLTLLVDEEEKEFVREADVIHNTKIQPALDDLIALVTAHLDGKDLDEKTLFAIDERIDGHAAEAMGIILKLQEDVQRHTEEELVVSTADASSATRTIIILSIIAVLFSIAIGVYTARRMTKPIQALEIGSKRLAEGDLRVIIDASLKSSDDEIGHLSTSFDTMTHNIKTLIGSIAQSTTASSSSAEELSASAEEVNASIEQVSSTVQEIAKGAQTLSKSVNDVARQSQQAGETALRGSKSAQAVKQKMDTISASTQAGASQIKALGEKSKRIGDIVQTINGISEQTNLLALNAAIEAARAGDAGRGFAVVADEVRKLAEESKKATATITELIGTIQGEISASVSHMDQNTAQVGESLTTISSAIETFEEIPRLVDDLNKAIAMISSIAEENAAGAEEVGASIEQVTSAMTQVASTAQQLSSSSGQLQQLVNKFQLDADTSKKK